MYLFLQLFELSSHLTFTWICACAFVSVTGVNQAHSVKTTYALSPFKRMENAYRNKCLQNLCQLIPCFSYTSCISKAWDNVCKQTIINAFDFLGISNNLDITDDQGHDKLPSLHDPNLYGELRNLLSRKGLVYG